MTKICDFHAFLSREEERASVRFIVGECENVAFAKDEHQNIAVYAHNYSTVHKMLLTKNQAKAVAEELKELLK